MQTTTFNIGGRNWAIEAVPNADALLADVHTDEALATFPYGLLLWPASVALAERLTQEPQIVLGKRVLELGAGVGLPGMAARHLGAAEVWQTDYQTEPLNLARRNAEANGITGITYALLDWRKPPADWEPFDVVLGSDILYERELHSALSALLPRFVKRGGMILLADPLRPASLPFLQGLEDTGDWLLSMEAQRALWPDNTEIALFFLRRR